MEQLREEYNKCIEKFKKAENYFETSPDAPERKVLYIRNLQVIINTIEALIVRFKILGYEMTEDEIRNGF